jgi:hypothetical protein
MTLRQTIQAAPGKTAELIKKLSGTSNQAVKTRENLFAQLSDELTRYVEIEQEHFLPMLRKHSGTKELAADALKGNRELQASLKKLSAMPKNSDEFLAELDTLNKGFQQYVRNERKELLPAVLKAFSDEEASVLADTIEGAVADAEKAKRDEKREEAAQARREAEDAEQAKAAERAAVRAQEAAQRTAREASEKAVDTVTHGVAAVQDEARQAATSITERTQEMAWAARDAVAVYAETSEKVREDVHAIRSSTTVSAGAASEIYSAWSEWFSTTTRINFDAAQKLMQARSVQQVAELQQAFATSALRNWMEGNVKILEITQRSSKQALDPLRGRLRQVG